MAEIIVTIPKKKKPQHQKHTKRGPLFGSPKAEYLPRRLQRNILINFYDLGQIPDGLGGWKDLDYYVVPSVTVDNNTTTHTGRFTVANWTAFYARLFTAAIADWKTAYRKIAYATYSPYSVTVTIPSVMTNAPTDPSNSFWTANGLKLNHGSYSGIACSGNNNTYFGFDTTDTFHYKVTTIYDPSASAIAFTLDASCDVFMIPGLGLEIGSSFFRNIITPSPPTSYHDVTTFEFLNFLYRVYPRSLYPTFRDHTLGFPVVSGTDTTGFINAYVNYLRTEANARMYKLVKDFNYPTTTILSSGWDDPTAFPFSNDAGAYQSRWFTRQFNDGTQTHNPVGYETDFDTKFFEDLSQPFLAGVIKKGSQFYYIWRLDGTIGTRLSIGNSPTSGYKVNYKSSY